MKYFILSLMVLASIQVKAHNRPSRIEVVNFPLRSAEAIDQQKAAIFNNLNSAIQQVANGPIELPPTVYVYMLKTYSNAFYYAMGDTLITPFQINFEGQTKHPKFTRAVDLHEFGHAIFEANLPTFLRNKKEQLEIIKAYMRRKPVFVKGISNYYGFKTAAELAQNTPDAESISLIFNKVSSDLDALVSSDENLLRNYDRITYDHTALNEFFADVFAVVLSRDPDVIRNALQFSSHVTGDQSARSFRVLAGRRRPTAAPHDLYSLSRYYIYKYYLSHPEVRRKGSAWIMRRTLESVRCAFEDINRLEATISSEVDSIRVENEERWVFEKYNNSLNDCIDQEFNK